MPKYSLNQNHKVDDPQHVEEHNLTAAAVMDLDLRAEALEETTANAAVQMRVSGGYLQYKSAISPTWINLIAISDIGGGGGGTSSNFMVVEWTGTAWPARPAVLMVCWSSTAFNSSIPAPPQMTSRDIWLADKDTAVAA